MCLPAEDHLNLMNNHNPSSQLNLNRLKSLTNGNADELRALVEQAAESLEEAHAAIFQASLNNNTTTLRETIHKITPLFHYLQADKILDIISCCVQSILRSTSTEEHNLHYQLILKNITGTLVELNETSTQEGL